MRMEPGSVQWTGTQEPLSGHQEALLCWVGDGAQAQVAQRGIREDLQKALGRDAGQPALGIPTGARAEPDGHRGAFQLQLFRDSVKSGMIIWCARNGSGAKLSPFYETHYSGFNLEGKSSQDFLLFIRIGSLSTTRPSSAV